MAIYFDPANIHKSQDFKQITDREHIRTLKKHLNLTKKDFEVMHPIVFGSITHSFNKKLRMMDARVFSLLALSDRDEVSWDLDKLQEIKGDMVKIIETTSIDDLKQDANKGGGLDFAASLRGWNKVLASKLQKNNETELMAINLPKDLDSVHFREPE